MIWPGRLPAPGSLAPPRGKSAPPATGSAPSSGKPGPESAIKSAPKRDSDQPDDRADQTSVQTRPPTGREHAWQMERMDAAVLEKALAFRGEWAIYNLLKMLWLRANERCDDLYSFSRG